MTGRASREISGSVTGSIPAHHFRLPRVLFVVGSLEQGGSEGQLVALLERVHKTRVIAGLIAPRAASESGHARRLEAVGVPFRVLSSGRHLALRPAASLRTLIGVLRAFEPHLVYAWLEESVLVAAPVARAFGIPVALARRNISGPYASRRRRSSRPYMPLSS
jgi:hypothetical protein